jgi:hypothetical protein
MGGPGICAERWVWKKGRRGKSERERRQTPKCGMEIVPNTGMLFTSRFLHFRDVETLTPAILFRLALL